MEKARSSSSAPRGMAHADFRIGTAFSSGGHIWLCTDVGTRTVIALRMGQAERRNAGLPVGREEGGSYDSSQGAHVESLFGEDDFPDCAPVALHAGSVPDESLERVGALTDAMALELAQRLGIKAESAILIALVSYLRQLGNRETLPQRIARVQALARAAAIAPCPRDDKALMDDMWGES